MKLWRVRLEFQSYVVAKDHTDAEQAAIEALPAMQPDGEVIVPVGPNERVPHRWRKAFPFEGRGCVTIRTVGELVEEMRQAES